MREEQDGSISVVWKAALWLAAMVAWGLWLVRHPHGNADKEGSSASADTPRCFSDFDPSFPERVVTRCAKEPRPVAVTGGDCKLVSTDVALVRRRVDDDASVVQGAAVPEAPNVPHSRQSGSISLRIALGADGVIHGIKIEQFGNCREADAENA